MPEFRYRSRIEAPAEKAFAWHARPGALERLTPPWETARVVERTGGIENGARAVVEMKVGLFKRRWVAEHKDYVEGRQFSDSQAAGPFARWQHTHLFEADGSTACYIEDQIEYKLPFGPIGTLAEPVARARLQRLFAYRHDILTRDLAAHGGYNGGSPMKILVSGSSGLIGSALVPFLTTGGHSVTRLVRERPQADEAAVYWNPDTGEIDAPRLEGHDAVVHLAGENIGQRWSNKTKEEILESRANGTRLLAESLAKLERPPSVLVSASAMGYYGDRGDEILTEDSSSGSLFLSEVCRQWEAATQPAADKGIRVVNMRNALALSPKGGALKPLLLPFRLGLGGRVGSGKQYWSWIDLDDMVGAIHHAIMTDELRGPVNAGSPNPVTNEEFTKTLGRVLGRPTLFPLPALATRAAFGQMADELLLASARMEPRRLLASGYDFRFPELEGALRHVLGK